MTALLILALSIIALAGLIATGYVLTQHRARAAADMAALAGAQTAVRPGATSAEACAAAVEAASAHKARVDECTMVGFNGLAAVSVIVAVTVPWTVVGLPSEMTAAAAAGNYDP
jgi:hypothetical protein